jgi:hypothetical protein
MIGELILGVVLLSSAAVLAGLAMTMTVRPSDAGTPE